MPPSTARRDTVLASGKRVSQTSWGTTPGMVWRGRAATSLPLIRPAQAFHIRRAGDLSERALRCPAVDSLELSTDTPRFQNDKLEVPWAWSPALTLSGAAPASRARVEDGHERAEP
ncbi:hypothetical protein GCM10022214_36270 [Actinomadura miaoliensis]|uniref:Uncharacterized protein n=1 Tax=Actinomadura miaoliensis TaxID=430685 RepID=A0ABP7VYR2_9ACTN